MEQSRDVVSRVEPDHTLFLALNDEVYNAQELLDTGIPQDRIVLAFRALAMRRLTDFAVT